MYTTATATFLNKMLYNCRCLRQAQGAYYMGTFTQLSVDTRAEQAVVADTRGTQVAFDKEENTTACGMQPPDLFPPMACCDRLVVVF